MLNFGDQITVSYQFLGQYPITEDDYLFSIGIVFRGIDSFSFFQMFVNVICNRNPKYHIRYGIKNWVDYPFIWIKILVIKKWCIQHTHNESRYGIDKNSYETNIIWIQQKSNCRQTCKQKYLSSIHKKIKGIWYIYSYQNCCHRCPKHDSMCWHKSLLR